MFSRGNFSLMHIGKGFSLTLALKKDKICSSL